MATSSPAASSSTTSTKFRSAADTPADNKKQEQEACPSSSFLQDLSEECLQHGFDVCDPIHTAWYNDLIEKEGHVEKGTLKKLPEPTAGSIIFDQSTTSTSTTTKVLEANVNVSLPQYNAVLISNSKFIWPFFVQWILSRYKIQIQNFGEDDNAEKKKAMDLLLQSNPFDTFVTDTLLEIVKTCCNKISSCSEIESYELFWSSGNRSKYNTTCHENVDQSSASTMNSTGTDQYHCFESKDDSFLVSMQRVAKVTGKYWHDEQGTKLCVHPEFGTWKAFRAVVVFYTRHDAENGRNHEIPTPPPYCPCPVATEEINAAKMVMEYAIKVSSGNSNIDYGTATGDGGGGGDKDQDRLCKYLHNTITPGSDWTKVPSSMRPWIQLRDCITIGRDEYRYSDPQLLYHYTKDPDILMNELRERMDLL